MNYTTHHQFDAHLSSVLRSMKIDLQWHCGYEYKGDGSPLLCMLMVEIGDSKQIIKKLNAPKIKRKVHTLLSSMKGRNSYIIVFNQDGNTHMITKDKSVRDAFNNAPVKSQVEMVQMAYSLLK